MIARCTGEICKGPKLTAMRRQKQQLLPDLIVETIKNRACILDVLLCLFPHVEYRAVATRTKDVLTRRIISITQGA